jgi:tetratricopeptide (TPR) repeat protein
MDTDHQTSLHELEAKPVWNAGAAEAPAGSSDVDRTLNPLWLIIITIVAGLAASAPLAGTIAVRCGYRRLGWIGGTLLSALGMLALVTAVFWGVEWYWTTLSLVAFHIVLGSILFLLLRKPYRVFKENNPMPAVKKGGYRQIISGIVGGAMVSLLIGMVGMIIYVLFLDRIFSTLMPVTFEDGFAAYKVFMSVWFLVLSGAIVGGFIGRAKPGITPGQIILYGFGLLWAYLTWLFALEIFIAIPGFQAGAATGFGWEALISPTLLGHLLVGFWWSVFLLFYVFAPRVGVKRFGRAAQLLGINLAAGLTLSICFGYSADMFLAMGRHLEREAMTDKAIKFYEIALKKEPQPWIASYLQYRVALANHRLGAREKAIRGFRKVVAKYTANPKLVAKASRFLDNLERSADKRRVVLAGVDTPTEYKSGYCVPNSLALAMRYWGADATARGIGQKITGLGSGTYIVNQSWYAEQAGFRHDFLPMAGLDDIKKCIDAGFPVLVYVPAHVFAIVGYDDALETFVTYDVATYDVWVEYIQKDFVKAWKRQATTLVLAYPPEKESLLPDQIRNRLKRLSDNYLHYQMHFLDAPENSISVPHLVKAAGDNGEFFFPLTILYNNYPGLRKQISQDYGSEFVASSIYSYFGDDFDEGIHQAGQYHNERWSESDLNLKYSVQYLIGQQQFDMVEELLTRIDEKGQISPEMRSQIGMIHLAQGKLEPGIDQLITHDNSDNSFYAGLANLKIGNTQAAVRQLSEVVSGCT